METQSTRSELLSLGRVAVQRVGHVIPIVGRVAEIGTFDELVAKGGIFSELVKRQVV